MATINPNDFELIEQVGKGSFGEVFKGYDSLKTFCAHACRTSSPPSAGRSLQGRSSRSRSSISRRPRTTWRASSRKCSSSLNSIAPTSSNTMARFSKSRNFGSSWATLAAALSLICSSSGLLTSVTSQSSCAKCCVDLLTSIPKRSCTETLKVCCTAYIWVSNMNNLCCKYRVILNTRKWMCQKTKNTSTWPNIKTIHFAIFSL